MNDEEFVHAIVLVTHQGFGGHRRTKLKALFAKVRQDAREEAAYELAQWVDKHVDPRKDAVAPSIPKPT